MLPTTAKLQYCPVKVHDHHVLLQKFVKRFLALTKEPSSKNSASSTAAEPGYFMDHRKMNLAVLIATLLVTHAFVVMVASHL